MRIQDFDLVVQRIALLMAKAEETADDGYLKGVALNLHSYYFGLTSHGKRYLQSRGQADCQQYGGCGGHCSA